MHLLGANACPPMPAHFAAIALEPIRLHPDGVGASRMQRLRDQAYTPGATHMRLMLSKHGSLP